MSIDSAVTSKDGGKRKRVRRPMPAIMKCCIMVLVPMLRKEADNGSRRWNVDNARLKLG